MKAVLLTILMALSITAHAEAYAWKLNVSYIDLKEGEVVRQAVCTQGKKKMLCVAVQKDNKLYVVVLDEKGEHSIYWISPKGNVLLWARDSI